jgi:hypothetical protein
MERMMSLTFLMFALHLWAPGLCDDATPVIEVPRAWILGKERSWCPLRESDVTALLGWPEMIAGSAWGVDWYYPSLGISVEWERPVVSISIAGRLSPTLIGALKEFAPAWANAILALARADYVPRASLVGVRWCFWGMDWQWRVD